jgi:hypothetical protein
MLKARVPIVLDRPEETWFDVELMHKDIPPRPPGRGRARDTASDGRGRR